MSTQFFFGWMFIMIFTAFYKSANTDASGLPQIVTYVWLQQAFLYSVALWIIDNELSEMIRSGQIAYELTRPQNLYVLWLAKSFGQRVSGVLLRFPLVLICASIMPAAYRLSPPAGVPYFFLFIISLFLGMCIVVTYMMVAYFTLFYIISSDGVLWVFCIAAQFLAGQFLPLLFFPDAVQKILYMLPFAYVSDFSWRIYTGGHSLTFAAQGIAVQLVWIAAFVFAGRLMLSRALKRAVSYGG